MNAVVVGGTGGPLDILGVIRAVDNRREYRNMWRRLMKLGEEYGEALQAYLAVTSSNNYKKLTPQELREELIDIVVVALDLLCYRVPGEEELTDDELNDAIRQVFERKVEKWKRVRQNDEAVASREVPENFEWTFPSRMSTVLPRAFQTTFDISTIQQLMERVHTDFDLYKMCTVFGYIR